MFDSLTSSLEKVFKNLRGVGKLSEKNVKDALRQVRMALLEADVNYQVARDFVSRVREKCLGEEVLGSITPGQQVVKRVHEEMVNLLGGTHHDFDFSTKPAGVMLLGLHGAGKTTTASKLALRWKNEGRKVLLVACDIRRPAAVDQLAILAEKIGVGIIKPQSGEPVKKVGSRALRHAVDSGFDRIIYDTGGRFQIDEELVSELKELKEAVNPSNIVLVLDSAIGQESVNIAESFNKALGITGLILTKLDGDARGGAALSVQSVTGCPILLTGTGEKAEDLEPFYPDRMASRILGMGDVVSLVEKAQLAVDEDEMARMQEKMQKNSLDLDDLLGQIRHMKKLGPMENLLEMLPGANKMPAHMREKVSGESGKSMGRSEAIIQSMTEHERRNPQKIDASRKRRIASGSGTEVRDVNELLKNFQQMKKMTKKMKGMMPKMMKSMKPGL